MHEVLRKLLIYKGWANERLFHACSDLGQAELDAAQPIKFGSLAKTLQHVYDMDCVWRAHLEGGRHPVTSRTPAQAERFDRLSAAQAEIDRWFIDFVEARPADALRRDVPFRFLDGAPGTMSAADMLLHVVNHGTYHRGHVSDMLYRLGRVSPVTDYPVFLRSVG